MERCILKDAVDLVYVHDGGSSASALGDRRVNVEVVLYVPPLCITTSRHVCLRMTQHDDQNMLL